jgi:ABC-type lipoprotein release transport system permease subunit
MALGANRASVLRMVLGQGMRLVIAGCAIGTIAMLVSVSGDRRLPVRCSTHGPPATLISGGLALVLVSALACLGPARRATAVDPVKVPEGGSEGWPLPGHVG